VPQTPIAWTTVYYAAAAVFLARRDRQWPRAAAGLVALTALGAIVLAPGLERAGPAPGRLRVAMLDVGQGDAIVVQLPTGQSLLVDAGGGPGAFDIGGRIVTPALWALGVRRLDYLAFTHPDLDHIGGAGSVARDLAPREIWEGVPVPRNGERLGLVANADTRHIAWRVVAAGDVMRFGSVELEVENPPLPDWERQKSRNEDSIVLRVRFADVEIWLTGDAGAEFEARAVAAHAFESTAPLRVVKVGHHGSRSSSTPAFVRALDPQIALISVGRGNLFGHPAPDVVARYERAGAEVFRTDRDAAVILETDGRDVFLRTWRGRTWVQMVRRPP
jgi:competence protein ComEC